MSQILTHHNDHHHHHHHRHHLPHLHPHPPAQNLHDNQKISAHQETTMIVTHTPKPPSPPPPAPPPPALPPVKPSRIRTNPHHLYHLHHHRQPNLAHTSPTMIAAGSGLNHFSIINIDHHHRQPDQPVTMSMIGDDNNNNNSNSSNRSPSSPTRKRRQISTSPTIDVPEGGQCRVNNRTQQAVGPDRNNNSNNHNNRNNISISPPIKHLSSSLPIVPPPMFDRSCSNAPSHMACSVDIKTRAQHLSVLNVSSNPTSTTSIVANGETATTTTTTGKPPPFQPRSNSNTKIYLKRIANSNGDVIINENGLRNDGKNDGVIVANHHHHRPHHQDQAKDDKKLNNFSDNESYHDDDDGGNAPEPLDLDAELRILNDSSKPSLGNNVKIVIAANDIHSTSDVPTSLDDQPRMMLSINDALSDVDFAENVEIHKSRVEKDDDDGDGDGDGDDEEEEEEDLVGEDTEEAESILMGPASSSGPPLQAPPLPGDKGPDFEERLRATQPIWYLPHINRATVVHYLQGKNVGVFIVRQSSKPQTLALSVRLPHGRGPHVEHYLIEHRSRDSAKHSAKQSSPPAPPTSQPQSQSNANIALFRLEGSEHYFTTILNLVVHYSNCCDELPVRLGLPPVLRAPTTGSSELGSLALLGQEFWQSKFVQLKQLPKNSLEENMLALVNNNESNNGIGDGSIVLPAEPPRLPPRRQASNASSAASNNSITIAAAGAQSQSSQSSLSPLPLIGGSSGGGVGAPVTSISVSGSSKLSTPTPPPPPPLPPKNIIDQLTGAAASSASPIAGLWSRTRIPESAVDDDQDGNDKNDNNNNNNDQQQQHRANQLQTTNPPPIPPRIRQVLSSDQFVGAQKLSSTPPPLPARPNQARQSPHQPPHRTSPKLCDLLSPTSVTESEIGEMLSHRQAIPFVGVSSAGPLNEMSQQQPNTVAQRQLSPAVAAAKANYYNHHIASSSSNSSGSPQPSSAAAPVGKAQQQQRSPKLSDLCDVYTQTDTNVIKANKNDGQVNDNDQQQQQLERPQSNLSSSTYYMDPIDALVVINSVRNSVASKKRHSDPELCNLVTAGPGALSNTTMEDGKAQPLSAITSEIYHLGSQHSSTLGHSLESLLENFRQRFPNESIYETKLDNFREICVRKAVNGETNAVAPVSSAAANRTNKANEIAFSTIDSQWAWHDCNGSKKGGRVCVERFAKNCINNNANNRVITALQQQPSSSDAASHQHHHHQQFNNNNNNNNHKRVSIAVSVRSDITTAEDIISAHAPDCVVPKVTVISTPSGNLAELPTEAANDGTGNYDNLTAEEIAAVMRGGGPGGGSFRSVRSSATTATNGTEFSEPWNMEMVESMILSEFSGACSSSHVDKNVNRNRQPTIDDESQLIDHHHHQHHQHHHQHNHHHRHRSHNSIDSFDATAAQLLQTDLIHFNSYLLNQEVDDSVDELRCNGAESNFGSDDYDNVAEDDFGVEDEDYHPMNRAAMKRDDSEATLKNHNLNNGHNNNNKSKNKINNNNQKCETPSSSSSSSRDKSVMLEIVNRISAYVIELAARQDNVFAKSIQNFIECTKDSAESNPAVILGYIRQFMNGMKNYLLKNGEGEFIAIVKAERARLRSNQFLNIDSILECTLQKLIIKPLKNFIYEICTRAYNANGSLKILSHNIKCAQNKTAQELGVPRDLLPLDAAAIVEVQQNVRRLQQSYSPIKKLEHLLRVISILSRISSKRRSSSSSSASSSSSPTRLNALVSGSIPAASDATSAAGPTSPTYSRSFSCDEQTLLPLLLYVMVQCGAISIEIEIEYMLRLLHSSILNGGDASYYLTVCSSAVQALKQMHTMNDPAVRSQLEDVISIRSNGTLTNGGGGFFASGDFASALPSASFRWKSTSGSPMIVSTTSTSSIFTASSIAANSIANINNNNNNGNSNNHNSSSNNNNNFATTNMKLLIPNELTSSIERRAVPIRANMTAREVCRMIARTYRITNPEDYTLYRISDFDEFPLLDADYPQAIKQEAAARGEIAMFAYKRTDAKFIWPTALLTASNSP